MKLKRFNTLQEAAQFEDPQPPAIAPEVANAVETLITYLESKPVSDRGKKLISELNALANYRKPHERPINQTV